MNEHVAKYASFRILLDEPSVDPALGFAGYASALTELITQSQPRFSVGIFGSWGSGKTSLMRAIKNGLEKAANPQIVTVWFNPWRYEKEQHLIVPLLDTLREALVDWSDRQSPDAKDRAVKAASTIGRAARAMLAGLSLNATLPLVQASLDPSKVIGAWRQDSVDDPVYAREPQSFYHASFVALRGALAEFFKQDVKRVVVFIDDLDRCLPENALDVLESMKLFFDLEGFVFVVGLDQSVIERAIAVKYASEAPRAAGTQEISATEYVKKIFQVPFAVPPIRPQQLPEYVGSIVANAGLGPEQTNDLYTIVQPHLVFLAQEQILNPREVKRFINAYTLQVKMLAPRLQAALDPQAVLAVQALAFRADWNELYKELASDPQAFAEDLAAALVDGYWPGRKRTPLPPSFVNYVQGVGAVLQNTMNLEVYIASVEATSSTVTSLLPLTKAVRDLWRAWGTATDPQAAQAAVSALQSALGPLSSQATQQSGGFSANLERTTTELKRQVVILQQPGLTPEQLGAWRERVGQLLETLEQDIDERRRTTSVGPSS